LGVVDLKRGKKAKFKILFNANNRNKQTSTTILQNCFLVLYIICNVTMARWKILNKHPYRLKTRIIPKQSSGETILNSKTRKFVSLCLWSRMMVPTHAPVFTLQKSRWNGRKECFTKKVSNFSQENYNKFHLTVII